jgi:hypothetical protein
VRQKFGGFDSADRVSNQMAELVPPLVSDRGTKVLDLDQPFADEHHLGHIGDAGTRDRMLQRGIQFLR